MRALWERLNQQRWIKSTEDDREYVLQAFQGDVEMPDQSDDEDEDHDGDEQADVTKGGSILLLSNAIDALESYDEDEEYDAPDQFSRTDTTKNSELAVGYKSDRSFVVRGDKIGVFKHTATDGLGKSSPVFIGDC